MNGLSGNSQRKLPLTARSKKTKMYFPKGIQHSLSPYTYSNDDPRKYMLSGYTGFVPKSRETIGKNIVCFMISFSFLNYYEHPQARWWTSL